ncbi:MAG: FAD-dependent monooxygenase [Acidimicrobiales bacterium]
MTTFDMETVFRQHAATWPRLDAHGADASAPEVIVVGAGPVGLTIAAGLDGAGLRTLVLEAESTVCNSSRANAISERTFIMIDRVAPGLGDRLIAESVPMEGGEVFYGRRLISSQRVPSRKETGGRYPPTSYLSQWNIEHALVEELSMRPNAELRWQSRVTAISQDDSKVQLQVSTPKGSYEVGAPWVVAADGGRSTLRRALGLRMEGLSYEVTFVVVDALVDGPQPPHVRRAWFDPAYLPGGMVLTHMPPEGIWRMDFQFPIGTDLEEAVRPQNVMRLIEAHLGEIGHPPAKIEPINIGTYKTRAVFLQDFRSGRVLFAGDAAHLVPIFGGFGLNCGIDDASNLEWKLAMVAAGSAPEGLLDTYTQERVPVVEQTLDFVIRATEFMTPTSRASEQLRTGALTLAAQGDALAAGLARHRPFRPFDCRSSAISPDDGRLVEGPEPGSRIELGWIELNGEAMTLPQVLGGTLSVVVVGGLPAASALVDVARAAVELAGVDARILCAGGRGSPGPQSATPSLLDTHGALREIFGAQGGLYVIRPDCVVAARFLDPTPHRLASALAAAVGRAR